MSKRAYDSTVARIAGNLLSGLVARKALEGEYEEWAVRVARAIVAEVQRTEPGEEGSLTP